MIPTEEHSEMLRLLKENNELLKKIHHWNVVGFSIRIVWYAILIGLPFALYFYVLQPYFAAMGSDYEVFRQGMIEIPGFKSLIHLLPTFGN